MTSATISPDAPADAPTTADFELRGRHFKVDVSGMPFSPQSNPYFRLASRGYLYEPVMSFVLANLLEDDGDHTFIDIGSSLGYYAAFAAAFIGDSSRVHAVEASDSYAERTVRSCAATGYPDVSVHNVILSDVEETAAYDGHRGVVYDDEAKDAKTTITGDALCAQHGIAPTIVKMDVHGCEGKLIQGMQRVLKDDVQYLLLELHDSFRLEQYSPGFNRSQLLSSLEEMGFTIFYVAGLEMPFHLARDKSFTYRPLRKLSPDVFFDRIDKITFLLASKDPDIEKVLGPSVDDPRFF